MQYLLVFLLLLSTVADAQVKFEMGPAINFDYGKYVGFFIPEDTKPVLRVNPGIVLGVNINNKIGIHSGFEHTTKVYEYRTYSTEYVGFGSGTYYSYNKIRNISMPLNISYNFLKKDKKLNAGLILVTDFSLEYGRKYNSRQTFDGIYSESSGFTPVLTKGQPAHITFDGGAGAFVGYHFTKHVNSSFYPYYKTDIGANQSLTTGATKFYHSIGCSLNVLYRF